MTFLQIIDFHMNRFDELQTLEQEWRTATEGKRTLQRSMVVRDRADASHYLVLAFFDSYESAMENSALPETASFAEKQAALADGGFTFVDFDVVEDFD
jgi:hypothetical protein